MKKKYGVFLGIGFWAGMAIMNLVNFVGSIIFNPNYYIIRYSFVMLLISIIFVIMGLVFLNKINRKSK